MTTPPVCSYEGSDYQERFWDQGDRAYEDQVEAIALRRLLPASGRRLLGLGAGGGGHARRRCGVAGGGPRAGPPPPSPPTSAPSSRSPAGCSAARRGAHSTGRRWNSPSSTSISILKLWRTGCVPPTSAPNGG